MRVFLRDVRIEDGNLIVKWRNNPSVIRHSIDKTLISEETNKEFFEKNILTERYRQYIVYKIDEQYGAISYPIGTVFLKDCDKINKRCELGIYEGTDIEWDKEAKLSAISMLLSKAFNEFGMHKVYAYVFSDDFDGKNLLSEIGFKEEGLLLSEIVSEDNNYRDIVRMSIFNEVE